MASAVFNDLFESLKLIQDATLADELDFEAISNSSNYWFEKGDDSICRCVFHFSSGPRRTRC